MKNNMNNTLGIYVHIPFCISKCKYCDFLSAPADDSAKERYVDALISEIKESAKNLEKYTVDTVFFGGGTPSALTGKQTAHIMAAITSNYNMAPYVESTIECNPGTLTHSKVETYLDAGFNRMSLGLQSANDNELKALGRIHTAADFVDSYLLARNLGFTNINVDLMCALPYQTLDSFTATLRSAAGLKPEHLSVYSLIVEEGTPMYDWVNGSANGSRYLPTEDVERQMYYDTEGILKEYGYGRYEISNYCRPNYECKHNLRYWERKNYAGFGCGAASLIEEVRYNNVSDIEEYIAGKGAVKVNEEHLTINDRMSEFMFLGLRKILGISKREFEDNFEKSYDEVYKEVTTKLIDEKLIIEDGDRIYLTSYGIDVSNVAMAEFLLD